MLVVGLSLSAACSCTIYVQEFPYFVSTVGLYRSQEPRGLRRESRDAHLLNTLSLRFSFSVSDHVSHSYKTTGKSRRSPYESINPLTPNDPYKGRTAPPTTKRCILYIYSTNIGTEYFKHGIYSPSFFLFKMQFLS